MREFHKECMDDNVDVDDDVNVDGEDDGRKPKSMRGDNSVCSSSIVAATVTSDGIKAIGFDPSCCCCCCR